MFSENKGREGGEGRREEGGGRREEGGWERERVSEKKTVTFQKWSQKVSLTPQESVRMYGSSSCS